MLQTSSWVLACCQLGLMSPMSTIYILIFRKGSKRQFKEEEGKARRRSSAYFWEERNIWFSAVWTDLKGINQDLCDKSARSRSGAYPFELAFRLICMYSLYEDLVFAPFLGSGTTTAAAIAACRNSLGVEYYRDKTRYLQCIKFIHLHRQRKSLSGPRSRSISGEIWW